MILIIIPQIQIVTDHRYRRYVAYGKDQSCA
ncbi:hypothetical protein EPr2_0063 [Providencia phage EPr2]|uniref:Uncharacterized protein n=1 Tax=Providencia phage EPr2 TaxID=2917333 RepID=A0AC61TT42_9CAUD|nr:hypothetical protein EPr2_0063 [Providencia phage EPr2]